MQKATNIVWHSGLVTPESRSRVSGAKGTIIWLTGLSGCGKSTIAMALEKALLDAGCFAYVLDGDNVRHGLNKNLGFSPEDRTENIRRIAEVAKLFADAGAIAIASFISPYRADRAAARHLVKPGEFVEIFVDAPIEICEQRDPKGLYKKARAAVAAGKGLQFTGIDAPYEAPENPEFHIRSGYESVEESVKRIVAQLRSSGRLLETGNSKLETSS
jgi:adenylylsulfate kinase